MKTYCRFYQFKQTLICSNEKQNPNLWLNALSRQMQFILIIIHNNALSHKLFHKSSRKSQITLNKRKTLPSAFTCIVIAILFHIKIRVKKKSYVLSRTYTPRFGMYMNHSSKVHEIYSRRIVINYLISSQNWAAKKEGK